MIFKDIDGDMQAASANDAMPEMSEIQRLRVHINELQAIVDRMSEEWRPGMPDRRKNEVADYSEMLSAAQSICHTISIIETRCMAADGPVTPTLQEMTESELRLIWKAANRIASKVSQ